MQPLKPWHVLLTTVLSVAGCRYGYDLLPLPEDQAAAGSGGEASYAGSNANGGTTVGGAPDGAGSGSEGNVAGSDETSAGEGGANLGEGGTSQGGTGLGQGGTSLGGTSLGGTSLGGNSGSSGSATGGAGLGGSGNGVPPDLALCNQATYGGHDYLLCQELRSWADANDGCTVVGMRLVRVDDANENQWLFTNANTPNGVSSDVWLGATDGAVEGEWRWTDGELFWVGDQAGTPQNGLFNGWYFREPNNVNEEDCLTLETAAKPEWYDHQCHLTLSYVCESL